MSDRLSKQERWILENAPRGRCWDLADLREKLPNDSRSRTVQAASLSRSVARLVERRLVERFNRQLCSNHGFYLYETVNGVSTLLPR